MPDADIASFFQVLRSKALKKSVPKGALKTKAAPYIPTAKAVSFTAHSVKDHFPLISLKPHPPAQYIPIFFPSAST
jgi:hypothetical protein